MKHLTPALAIAALAAGAYLWFTPASAPVKTASETQTNATTALVEITLPASLSTTATLGKTAFNAKCASCHAENAVGQDGVAPPLVHKIYEPSHHGDESFQRAAKLGVRAHHWRFGDMPPVNGVTRGDVKMIVAYIRELQAANGIH